MKTLPDSIGGQLLNTSTITHSGPKLPESIWNLTQLRLLDIRYITETTLDFEALQQIAPCPWSISTPSGQQNITGHKVGYIQNYHRLILTCLRSDKSIRFHNAYVVNAGNQQRWRRYDAEQRTKREDWYAIDSQRPCMQSTRVLLMEQL